MIVMIGGARKKNVRSRMCRGGRGGGRVATRNRSFFWSSGFSANYGTLRTSKARAEMAEMTVEYLDGDAVSRGAAFTREAG